MKEAIAAAAIALVILGLGAYLVNKYGNSRYAEGANAVYAKWAKATTDAADAAAKDNAERITTLGEINVEAAKADVVDESKFRDVVVQRDRLQQRIDTLTRSYPAATDSSPGPENDATAVLGGLFGECKDEAVRLAEEARKNRAPTVYLQDYIRRVVKPEKIENDIPRESLGMER